VLYFGHCWKQGQKTISEASGNSLYTTLYNSLKSLKLWNFVTKFVETKYPAQYKLLMSLPEEDRVFGLYPYLVLNFNHLCIDHQDHQDAKNINCFVFPFGNWTSGGDIILKGFYTHSFQYRFPAKHGSFLFFDSRGIKHCNDGTIIGGYRNSIVLTAHNSLINIGFKEFTESNKVL